MKKWHKIALNIMVVILLAGLVGFVLRSFTSALPGIISGEGFKFNPWLILSWKTWAYGAIAGLVIMLIWLLSGSSLDSLLMEGSGGLLKSHGKLDVVEGSLENSRFRKNRLLSNIITAHSVSYIINIQRMYPSEK